MINGVLLVALLAGVCFVGATLLPVAGVSAIARRRSYAIAIAAGLLLALSFGDLFPEALEMAGEFAAFAFIAGFGAMFLVETLTHAHTHHGLEEEVHAHRIGPLLVGLAAHNLADGFTLGTTADLSDISTAAVGIGVLVHQIPVGLSLAAIFAASHTTTSFRIRATILLGLAIPIATVLTLIAPVASEESLGLLVGVAGGILAYMGASHLLPEAQAENPSRATGVLFALTLALMTAFLYLMHAE